MGDTVELVCEADSSWEYCSWTRAADTCRMEWKRAQVRAGVAGTRVTPSAAAEGDALGGLHCSTDEPGKDHTGAGPSEQRAQVNSAGYHKPYEAPRHGLP